MLWSTKLYNYYAWNFLDDTAIKIAVVAQNQMGTQQIIIFM